MDPIDQGWVASGVGRRCSRRTRVAARALVVALALVPGACDCNGTGLTTVDTADDPGPGDVGDTADTAEVSDAPSDADAGRDLPPAADVALACPTALPSCVTFAAPPGPEALGPPIRFVGLLPGNFQDPLQNPCPQPLGNPGDWKFGRLFEADQQLAEQGIFPPDHGQDADGAPSQGVFCLYEWAGVFPVDEALGAGLQEALPPTQPEGGVPASGWLAPDLPVVVPLGTEAELVSSVKTDLNTHALAHQRGVDVLPEPTFGAPDRVRVAVVDSALPSAAPGGVPGDGQLAHGRDVGLIIRQLACPEVGAKVACAVDIVTHLALDLEPDGLGGSRPAPGGGFFGTPAGLARAIWQAVVRWKLEAPGDTRLILNLSVGWEGSPTILEPGEDAVRRVLRRASCLGALVVAAAGNEHAGPQPSVGPMLPAAWELEAAPGCPLVGGGVYRPLVHSAGGVDGAGEVLDNARDEGAPRLAGHAFQVPGNLAWQAAEPTGPPSFDSPVLTGSSVAAAVVSAAAAAVWFHEPGRASSEVMDAVFASARPTEPERPSDYCLLPPCAPVRQVSVCGSLAAVVPGFPPGGDCPAGPPLNLPWTTAQLAEAEALAEQDVALVGQQPRPVEACGQEFTLFTSATDTLPEFPCPSAQVFNDLAVPTVDPAPSDPGCDVCSLDPLQGLLVGRLSPFAGQDSPLTQVTLVVRSASGRQTAFQLTPRVDAGEVFRISGLALAGLDIQSAVLTGLVEGYRGALISRSEQVPVAAAP